MVLRRTVSALHGMERVQVKPHPTGVRSATYTAVMAGAVRLSSIAAEVARILGAEFDVDARQVDRALQWHRKRGHLRYEGATGWVRP